MMHLTSEITRCARTWKKPHPGWHSAAELKLLLLLMLMDVQGAIKLCNAGIQKYPDCFTFKSLKAVALDRCGKRDEALQVWVCRQEVTTGGQCCRLRSRTQHPSSLGKAVQ